MSFLTSVFCESDTFSFHDLRHDLREYPILACVRVFTVWTQPLKFTIFRKSSTSLQTYSSTHECVPSTVVTVSVSSCIVPTIINDPARVSKHEILAVSTGVKIILSDLGSTCNVLLSPAVLTLLVDWDQYFTVLITQSLVVTPAQFVGEQDTRISHIPHDLDLRLVGLILISEIICLGLRQLSSRLMLMITFDLSWADTFKFFSQTLSLASTRFSACCSPAVGTALSFVHGFWGSGSLAVPISSRPFGTCFNQPTIHPLGLKASVVHGRFIRPS